MRYAGSFVSIGCPGSCVPDAGTPTRSERGSATILTVGLLAALVLTTIGALGACSLLAEKRRVEAAADAAALAAADAASGRVAGIPCERAAYAAGLNSAAIDDCDVDGPNVEVIAVGTWGGVPITVRARAGPPESR
ncbi:flp pilus-assembly TadE/G-like family protein [Planctomonas sp. JC2975]|uniref:Rv3654c family TadE-like protein n=1 Tax=Planctomonas sp. JC2975 TaxID=2729626 RepID=UPI0014733996|nr:Rv3654c family TadE-like protein [Planctomonas sp. JC2975]NNC12975.1 flp pilus-assembly TadE/G-like family protein [Planctomonas sp. JC2975]